ncbi:uncharacterized protein DS421_17g585360 [Arachis hypogaea]|nr:uncharacterized protein DS421_17g585360 [Arachis hypogaea]
MAFKFDLNTVPMVEGADEEFEQQTDSPDEVVVSQPILQNMKNHTNFDEVWGGGGGGGGGREGKKGKGEPPSRRRRPAAAALPFALTPEQPRPSPLLLSFSVSDDLLEPELTAGEPLLLHHGAATWSLPASPPSPPASLPASPLSVPVAEGIRDTTARYSPSSPFPSCPDHRRSTTASLIPSFLISIFIIQLLLAGKVE